MVTMVTRAFAVLVALALLVLGAPVAPTAAAVPPPAARADGARPAVPADLPAALWDERDSGAVALAFPGWSGDHRPQVRDLPDAYSPELPWSPPPGGPWGRVPPPVSAPVPDTAVAFALPPGRAPPLTARV
ncbi:hypothetical protein LG943_08710 [Streptomonospora sp. S1-112]|uniref:Uncharacterized protein n=1 Tax=Streptomonospora mangrovi TaxID=2883123 RepID=A0A9X3SF33_9ACTN|nr:hypothetical protein [Streptomonospora mangrovi]MDA0564405.1 hypothetical protein [Streptomonospora mangrovi]